MVSFKLSFLLQFESMPIQLNGKEKKKRGGKKMMKEKKNKKLDKNSKSSKKSKKKLEMIDEKRPKYVREVGSPITYVHIEYNLIPNRVRHKLDVVFWGPIVKVFSEEDVKIMTTIKTDNTTWALIQIVHFTNTFDTEEIFKLHAHVLNIVVSTKKNLCGSKAKTEKTKMFYLMEKDVNVDEIVEVFTEDPNLIEREETHSLNLFMYDIIGDCYSRPSYDQEVVSLLKYGCQSLFVYCNLKIQVSDKIHNHQANKIIKNASKGVPVITKQFAPICLSPTAEEETTTVEEEDSFVRMKIKKDKRKKVAAKDKKSTRKKKFKKDKRSVKSKKTKVPKVVLKFTVPGEVFITNPRLSVFALENSDSYLKSGFLLISVNNLFNTTQELVLNPLIISMESLKNIPTDILSSYGFTDLYAEYNVPHICRCKSLIKSLQNHIVFNEAHAHFIDTVPDERLIQFILTEPFLIKIVGLRNIDETNENSLYGTGLNNCYLSEKLSYEKYVFKTKEKRNEVVLATFGFDISKLSKSYYFCNEHNNNNAPEIVFFGCNKQKKIDNLQSVNYVNITMPEYKIECENLLQHLLVEHGTTLNVKIKFYTPAILMGRPNLPLTDNVLRRLLIIFFDRVAFNNIYHIVKVHNQFRHNSSNLDNIDDVLTGFAIDNSDSIIMYVEGICTGIIARLLYILTSFPNASVNLHFNSKLLFDKRLYERFINMHGGILKINLLYPLQRILSNENFYVRGNAPNGCFNAILKLSMLYKSSLLISMCNENIFPSAEELTSLNIELGVPFYNDIIEEININESESLDYDSQEDIIYSCDMY